MHQQGLIGSGGMMPGDVNANNPGSQGAQHFSGAYMLQQDGQQQMIVTSMGGQRMMRPMTQLNVARMNLAQQQGQQQSAMVGRLVQQQPGGPIMMQARASGPGVVVVSMPGGGPGTPGPQQQQPQPGLPIRISLTETEVRVLQALPEESRQKLLCMPEGERKTWIRNMMIEMHQNKMSLKNAPMQMAQLQPQQQQWVSGGQMEMTSPHQAMMMDQQQHYSTPGGPGGSTSGFVNQQFVQQQRYVQVQQSQQQQPRPQLQQLQPGQQTGAGPQMMFRVGPRPIPTPQQQQQILAQQQQRQQQQQFGMSPSNFGGGGVAPMNVAYASPAGAGAGPSPGGGGVYGASSQQAPSPGYAATPIAYGVQQTKMAGATNEIGAAIESQHGAPQQQQLNTGTGAGSGAGPASVPGQSYAQLSADDSAYREKIRELQVYLDYLKRTLEQQQRDGNTANQIGQNKIQKVIDILEGRTKVQYEVLLKCEEYLKNTKKVPEANADSKSKIFQPFLEAIASLISKPTDPSATNEIFRKTFDFTYADIPENKRIVPLQMDDADFDDSSNENDTKSSLLPLVVEREIAFLNHKYKIDLVHQDDARKLKDYICLSCQIEDKDLPLVPSLLLKIPNNYPIDNPGFELNLDDQTDTCALFGRIKNVADCKFSRLGVNYTITTVLNTWRSSIMQACSV